MPKLDEINEVVLLAGGFGTRIREVLKDTPKLLAPIGEQTLLDHLISYFIPAKISHLIISTGFLAEKISRYVNEHAGHPMDITLAPEDKPLGTGGAIRLASEKARQDTFLVLNGDSFCPVNYSALLSFHHENQADITLALTSTSTPERYGSVHLDKEGRIVRFKEKQSDRTLLSTQTLINVGVYVINKAVISKFPEQTPLSFEHDVLQKCDQFRIFGLPMKVPFIDIGTPESLAEAEDFFNSLPGETG